MLYFELLSLFRYLAHLVNSNPFIAFCALALLQLLLEWRRSVCDRRLRSEKAQEKYGDKVPFASVYTRSSDGQVMPYGSNLQQLVREQGFERKWTDFELEKELKSKGACGAFQKGKIDERIVVAKGVRENSSIAEFEIALAELQILLTLGKHGHEHVAELVGACTQFWQSMQSYIFLEFCPLGDLQSFLAGNRELYEEAIGSHNSALEHLDSSESRSGTGWCFLKAKKPLLVPKSDKQIAAKDLHIWSSQIAKGMAFLDEKHILHGDLAARNVLLKSLHHIKIADFGLARMKEFAQRFDSKVKVYLLPWRQMSLESLYREAPALTVESEVWSFGVTCWEIFSLACIPYGNVNLDKQFMQRLEDGERLPHPQAASKEVYSMLMKCWAENPKARPSFEELALFFERQFKSEQGPDTKEQ